jgi:hypothetical protein
MVQGFLEKLVTIQSRNSLVLKDLEISLYSQTPPSDLVLSHLNPAYILM